MLALQWRERFEKRMWNVQVKKFFSCSRYWGRLPKGYPDFSCVNKKSPFFFEFGPQVSLNCRSLQTTAQVNWKKMLRRVNPSRTSVGLLSINRERQKGSLKNALHVHCWRDGKAQNWSIPRSCCRVNTHDKWVYCQKWFNFQTCISRLSVFVLLFILTTYIRILIKHSTTLLLTKFGKASRPKLSIQKPAFKNE